MRFSTLPHVVRQDIEKATKSVTGQLLQNIDFLSINIDKLAERVVETEDSIDKIYREIPMYIIKNGAFELVEEDTGIPAFWSTGGTANGRQVIMDDTTYIYGSRSPRLVIHNNTLPGTIFLSQDVVPPSANELVLSFYYMYNDVRIKPYVEFIGRDGEDVPFWNERVNIEPMYPGYWRRTEVSVSGVPFNVVTLEIRVGFEVEETGLEFASMWIDGVILDTVRNTFRELHAGVINSEHIQTDSIISRHIAADQIEARHIAAHQIESHHISTVGLDASVITSGEIHTDILVSNILDAINASVGTIEITEKLTLTSADGNVRIHSVLPDPENPLSGGGRISIYNAIEQEIISIGHLDGSDYGMRVTDGWDNTIFLVDGNGIVKMASESVTVDSSGIYTGTSFGHDNSSFGIGVDGSVYIRGHLQAKSGSVDGLLTVGDYINLRGSNNFIGISSTIEHKGLVIGVGTGDQYQFDIPYRPIVKGTVYVFLDGNPQFSGFTIDYDYGFIEFEEPPAPGVEISIEYVSVHEDVIKIGEYSIDRVGMIVSSVTDPDKSILIDHRGLLFSFDGGHNWIEALTGEGINATAIRTGVLDADIVNVININASNITTGTLNITDRLSLVADAGGQNSFIIDDSGLRVIDASDSNKILLIDNSGVHISRDGGASWDFAITPTGINASVITTGVLDADIVNVVNLSADNITSGSIATELLVANVIKAINSELQTATIDSARIGSLSADKITSGDIATERLVANVIHAINSELQTAQISEARIEDLSAEKIITGNLSADVMSANVISAINAYIGEAVIDGAKIGELSADKITSGDIATERLVANVIHAINSELQTATINEARIGNLSAEKITAGDLLADVMTANVISAINAYIGDAVIDGAKIGELSADKITTGSLSADVMIANVIEAINAEIQTAKIDGARIGELKADQITSGTINTDILSANIIDAINLYAGESRIESAKIEDLDASKITAGDISADRIKANVIAAINAYVGEAVIDGAKIGSLDADQITSGDISADRIKAHVIDAINAYVGEAVIDSAKISDLSADKITTGNLSADVMTTNVIDAINAYVGTAVISDARIGNIRADKITTGNLSADVMVANVISAINADIQTAKILGARIDELSADQITSGTISTDILSANVIDAINLSVGTAKIQAAKIEDLDASKIVAGDIAADRMTTNVIDAINAYIGQAVIEGAKIGSIDASKITSGDIHTDRLKANVIDAINAYIGSAVIEGAKIGNLSADKIVTGALSADVMKTNVIDAVNAYVGQAVIDGAKIGNLSADKITTGNLSADVMVANVIAAINAEIQSAKIDGARIGELSADQITSGTISTDILKSNIIDAINLYTGTAVIESAKIGSIDASKITSGDIDTDRLKANVINAINLSAEKISTDRLSVTGIMEAINTDGSTTRISGGKIYVKAEGADQGFDLTEFFTVDNNVTLIHGGNIATGTISAAQLSIEAFGNSNGINLISNASFIEDDNEDGIPNNWEAETFSGSIDRSIDDTEYRFNFKSFKMSANLKASGTIISDPFEVEPNTMYVASGYVKSAAQEGQVSLEVVLVYEDNTTDIRHVAVAANDNEWRRYHALIYTDMHDTAGRVTHVRFRCRVDDFVGDAWFDGVQFEKGSLLTGFRPREMTETQIGPGTIRTHHISAVDFDASVIRGGQFVINESLTLKTQDNRILMDNTGMSITGGALRFNSSSGVNSARLTLDETGIKGYKSGSVLGFHLNVDGTATFYNSININSGDVVINNSGITVTGGNNAIRVVDGGYIFVGNATTSSGTRIDHQGVNVNDVIRLGSIGQGYGLQLNSSGVMSLLMNQDGFIISDGTQNPLMRVTSGGNLQIRGTIYATDGEFSGTVKSNSGYFGTEDNHIEISEYGLTVVGEGKIVAGHNEISSDAIIVRRPSKDTEVVIGEKIVDGIARYGIFAGDVTIDGAGLTIKGTLSQIALGPNEEFFVDGSGQLKATGAVISGSVFIEGSSEFKSDVTIKQGGSLIAGNIVITDKHITVSDDNDVEQLKVGEFNLGGSIRYGLIAGDAILDSSGLTISGTTSSIALGPNAEFSVDGTGYLKAVRATFGGVINVDNTGVYHGSALGHNDSSFGIGADGTTYLKGLLTIQSGSVISGNLSVSSGGRIFAGTEGSNRFEITSLGVFGYDSNNNEIFAVDATDGEVRLTANEFNVKSGRILDTLYVGSAGADIRVGEGAKPVINLYHPNRPGHVVRLAAYDDLFGLYYSTDGVDFRPALTGQGLTANAITDGNLYIVDTDMDGEGANGIFVRRRVKDEEVILPSEDPFGYAPLRERNVDVKEVWDSARTIRYEEGVDYAVNTIDGMIARIHGSRIPVGATILVTYDWNVIDINSQFGIRVKGLISVENDEGTTLIGGGFVRVQGLDVGVFMSDNFILNGDFSQTSIAWGTAQTNDGKSIPGFPEYPAGEPFFGDWYQDRLGRFYRFGAAYWIPSKSDTTYDEHGNMTGYASVSFTPNDFLHNIYGYANLELGGSTYQWAAIEQDVYPFLNYSDNPDHIIPAERFDDVVFSAGFHWHTHHSSQNEIRMEVDELVPNYVFVEATRTSPFTPTWDNVHDEYNGITYGAGKDGTGWYYDDHTFEGLATGDNVAFGKNVSSNAQIVLGTEAYVVDNDFLREHWATRTAGSGYHYIQIDLGSVKPVNEIRVWHSLQTNRRYRRNKVEVSADGNTWETIFDTAAFDEPYKEGQGGKIHMFPTKNIRYIRDWIDGYEVLDVQDQVIDVVELNQWIDIQARHCVVAVTDDPGAYFEWEFTPKSRADLWIGFIRGPEFGIASVEINGVRVSTINQGVMIGLHDSNEHDDEHFAPMHEGEAHYQLAYIDVSSQEELQIIPRKKHIVRVTFLDIPENHGKKFTFTRIKLEDFQTAYTTSQVIASDEIRPANPYGFYYPQIVPNKARHYLGVGRQTLKGMYDNTSNYSPSANVWLRYRFRIISIRQAGGDLHGHDHVMISAVTGEYGTKRTHFRRSSLDTTPSQFLQPWINDDHLREITGVHTKHIADGAVTNEKILSVDWSKITNIPPDLGADIPLMTPDVRGAAKLGEGLSIDQNERLNIKWAGSGGNYGTATTVARSDHKHNWTDISGRPSSATGDIDDAVAKRHSQNTDIGTTSTAFGLNIHGSATTAGIYIGGSDANGQPYMRWNNSNNRWEFYRSFSSNWAEVRAATFRNSSGVEVSYQGHDHNDLYYTKANLQTSGQATIHWDNIINASDTATRWPTWSEVTSKPFNTVGTGLTVSSNQLRVSFGGTGSANTVARSDHNHDSIYAKLDGATITGAYVFTKDDGVALEINATNPNRSHSESVTFNTDEKILTYSPVVRGSVVVKNTTGSVTYNEGDDYTIDYLNGTIKRESGGSISSGQTVSVTYEYTREVFRTRTGGTTKFSIDSDGNIRGTSIVVQVQASEETSETSGSFTVDGDLTVTGSTVLGDDASHDTTTITGGFTVTGTSGTTFSVNTSGAASLSGILNAGGLQVNGQNVVLASELQNEINDALSNVYTKSDLANATAGTTVHWNTLTNLPAYATRWPTWSEVTNKPSTFTPSAHTHSASDITSGTIPYARLPFSESDVSNWNTAYGWGDYRNHGLGTTSTVNSGTLSSLNRNVFFAHNNAAGDDDWSTSYGQYPMGIHWQRSSSVQAQIAIGHGSSGRLVFRNKISDSSWSPWRGVWHDGDFTSSDISNWNTAYNERRQWDGSSTNLNAATARQSLGLTGDSNTTHYHDGRYWTKTQLETSGQASVHWGNLVGVPTASTSQLGIMRVGTGLSVSSGIVSVNFASSGGENGTSTQSARADHFHKGLEQVVGPGVLQGMQISPTNPVSKAVNVSAGSVVLSDGYVLYTSGDTIDLGNYISGAGSRYVVIYVIGTRTTGTPYGVVQGPTDGQSLPALPPDAIPLARVFLPVNATSVPAGSIKDIRKYSNLRLVGNTIYGYQDYIYNTSTNQAERREPAWSLDAQGRLQLNGPNAGVSTDGGVTFVDVSAKAPGWDVAAAEAHKHVWNEIPARINATTYKLSYPVRLYDGRPAIQLYRRGLYMTPGVDYTITNDTIVFTESVGSNDNVVANYVRV